MQDIQEFTVPEDVQDRLSDDGQQVSLKNTLLRIWQDQADKAVTELKNHEKIGFGFAMQVAQKWGLTSESQVQSYTKRFIKTSIAFWELILACAEDNPEALKVPIEGTDGEVNREVYIDLVNAWFQLSWGLQVGWDLKTDGLAQAYAIQDVLEGFIGQEGMIKHLALLPDINLGDVAFWTPGDEE